MKNDPIKLRTVFMGTSNFASTVLEKLLDANYNIVTVITSHDKPAGRNKELRPSPVKILAGNNKLEIFQPQHLKDEEIEIIKKIKPDFIIVVAYGKILPKEILEIPGFGCLNIHGSLLPLFRGPSPIQNALLNGATETGVSIILMDETVDGGDIIAEKALLIDVQDNFATLSEKMSALASQLLLETLPFWIERKLEPKKQNEDRATFCQLIERSDGKIFWTDFAEEIFNKYRAFYEWPQIFTSWKTTAETLRLKLIKISCLKNNPDMKHKIGQVFEIGENIGVQTGRGIIILEQIQLEGKNPLDIKDFINGYPDFINSVLE
jgi:methionyl-tRNA formyltransferase